MTRGDPSYKDASSWLHIRVWWLAEHRFRGTTHLAVSTPNGRMTRCGLKFTLSTGGGKKSSKGFKTFTWVRLGHDPVEPTCPQCKKLFHWDQQGQLGNPVGS